MAVVFLGDAVPGVETCYSCGERIDIGDERCSHCGARMPTVGAVERWSRKAGVRLDDDSVAIGTTRRGYVIVLVGALGLFVAYGWVMGEAIRAAPVSMESVPPIALVIVATWAAGMAVRPRLAIHLDRRGLRFPTAMKNPIPWEVVGEVSIQHHTTWLALFPGVDGTKETAWSQTLVVRFRLPHVVHWRLSGLIGVPVWCRHPHFGKYTEPLYDTVFVDLRTVALDENDLMDLIVDRRRIWNV